MIRSAAIVVLVAGCQPSTPREAFDCSCAYLTDTDVPGQQRASVCVEQGKSAESAASDCVSGMGVGHVEKCTCTKADRACDGPSCSQP